MAVKDSDGKFRYKSVIGPTTEGVKTMLQIAYSSSDLFNETIYPSTAVSEITRFYMSENAPYAPDEISTYARPKMISEGRGAPDDMIEADYIDIYIRGARNEILGYFELGSTRNGKLPNKRTIRWLESIANILATIFVYEHV
jgi:hypothetical protein